jgi:hypothetical protein
VHFWTLLADLLLLDRSTVFVAAMHKLTHASTPALFHLGAAMHKLTHALLPTTAIPPGTSTPALFHLGAAIQPSLATPAHLSTPAVRA